MTAALALAACGDATTGMRFGMGWGGAGSGGGNVVTTGLPCDVATFISSHCASCHRNPPIGGAPMSLLSRDDLLKPSSVDPTKTYAERALVRLNDATSPMPPGQVLPASEIAVFAGWVSAGMPAGDCGAGGSGGGVVIACTSNTYWQGANEGSRDMHPGRACNACHSGVTGEDTPPLFAAAGTVFPTFHEPDDCNGLPAVTVEITDANGQVAQVSASSPSGNFIFDPSLYAFAFPIHAKVIQNGNVRAMSRSVPTGDCNSCHTVLGATGAPGRIMGP